jgi:hypothetical protein
MALHAAYPFLTLLLAHVHMYQPGPACCPTAKLDRGCRDIRSYLHHPILLRDYLTVLPESLASRLRLYDYTNGLKSHEIRCWIRARGLCFSTTR